MFNSLLHILFVAGNFIGRGQGTDYLAKANHGLTVFHKIIGIGHSIAVNVWPIRVFWVGPEIISFREKIVLTARTSWR
ncbi:hypothetical protein D3C85_1140780 [compost metagenome]